MFERLRDIRKRWGVGAAIVIGGLFVLECVVDNVGRIDTVRSVLDPKQQHWFVRLLTGYPPWVALVFGAVGFGLLIWAIVVARRGPVADAPPMPVLVTGITSTANAELRREVADVARQLRDVQNQIRMGWDAGLTMSSALQIANAERRAFEPVRSQAVSLWDELLHRLRRPRPHFADPGLSELERSAVATLENGSLAGPNPAADVAVYLEGLARQLPP